ncbi:MAG: hypothetical protein EOP51_09545 [Sphingobacteriales bacterium]|nr:MAG: hypothetical protein EOP51_09545 [Sphingobacteriales bacterium]
MCPKYTKHTLVSISVFLAASTAFAQNIRNGENSPYTRFGIGELKDGTNTNLRGMGRISAAYSSEYTVNTENPASYASLKLTTYEAGGEGSTRTIHSNGDTYKSGMGGVSYLNIGIPVGKHAGIAFGLKPMARVYYSLSDTLNTPGFGNGIYRYDGGGSLNYGYLGAAYKIKGFSIGANFGYVFGTIDKVRSLVSYNDTEKVQNTVFVNSNQLGGIYWKGGAMYETKINKKMLIRAGGTVTLSQKLNAKVDELWMSQSNASTTLNSSGTTVYVTDTAYGRYNVRDKVVLPATYNVGVQLVSTTNKWLVGIDYTSAQWSQFRNVGNTLDSVADQTSKIAIGGEFTPNPASLRSYFQRVTYRLGFYYGTDYIRLRNTDMNYYAVTGGLSLPFKRSADRLHIAAEVGKRGTEANGLSSENFVRFSLGISLNDKWFIKRKYE